MNKECKLVVLDLDGTLTNSEKILPQANYDALMRLQQKGVQIALASGRPSYGIRHLATQLHLAQYNGFVMAYNGALITSCATNEVLSATVLSKKLLPSLCQTAQELNVAIITYDDANDTILSEVSGNKWIEHEAWLNNQMKLKIVNNLNDVAPSKLPKCLMVGEPDYMATIEPIVRQKFQQLDVYRSSPFFLEIVPKGVDKAKSIETLRQKLNISVEQIAAFGDGYNDISMVKYAGIGVAMANGCDEIKKVANFVSVSNDDCGVAYAIEKLGL